MTNKGIYLGAAAAGLDAGERAGGGLGADQAGRDRGRGRRRRRVRPDGAHDAGRDPEEQSDEAADGRLAQGRRVGRRGADLHEAERRRRQQGPARLFADLHAAAVGQDPVQLARSHAGRGHRARPVRAVGQHHAAVQEREGFRRRRQGRQPAVQDGRHRLQARGPGAHRLHGEEDRREIPLSALQVRRRGRDPARRQSHRSQRQQSVGESRSLARRPGARAVRVRQGAHRVQDQGHRHAVVERHPDLQGGRPRRAVPDAARHLPARQGDAGAERVLCRPVQEGVADRRIQGLPGEAGAQAELPHRPGHAEVPRGGRQAQHRA